jgi:ABC-type transport system substrate-binding protein
MMDGPWQHDQLISVVRFDDYYGEKALLDGVNFQVFRDEETAFLEFRAGNVDFTHVPPGQIEPSIAEFGESEDGLEAAPGAQVLIGPETAIYFVGINMNDELLGQNLELRKAISMAINREAINTAVYEGVRNIAGGFVPEGITGFEENAWGENSQYNLEQAQALMEEAGYPNGEGLPTFSLGFNSGAGHEEVMQLVQQDLQAIGINVEFESSEFAQFLDARDAGEFQLFRSGWLADYPTQDNFLYPLFHSEAADNDSFYNNPEVDQALLDARAIPDAEESQAAYLNVEKMIGEDVPVVPITHYRHRDVVSARVNGFIYDPIGLGHWDLAWISE